MIMLALCSAVMPVLGVAACGWQMYRMLTGEYPRWTADISPRKPSRALMAPTNATDDGDRLDAGQATGSESTPTDPTPPPRDGRPAPPRDGGVAPPEHWAGQLRDTIPSMFLYATLSQPFRQIEEKAYRIFRDRLLADCGSPTDPIEVMVIEPLALAHFNFGFLQCKATNAPTIQAAGVYASAASRLMGEFRRSALALQAYRAASRNLAATSAGDVVVPAADPSTRSRKKTDRPPNWERPTGAIAMEDTSSRSRGPGASEPKRKFSAEGLERLRAAALANRPWTKARGPVTPQGKERSARNGRYRQEGKASRRELAAELKCVFALMESMANTRRSLS